MEQQLTVEQIQQIWKLSHTVESVETKVDEMYIAIVGNKKMGQKGMAERMDSYEQDSALFKEEFKNELLALNSRVSKHENFIKGALWVVGIAGVIVGFFINAIINLK